MNYDIKLNGVNEFYSKLNNKTYNVLKVDSKKKQEFMINFFNNFINNQNKNINEKHYLGIDFEFNKVRKTERDVALMQMNLENDNNVGTIFVFYPPELSEDYKNVLIKLLTNNYIIKVLHGAESLDIPYLFNQLLIEDELIDKFCMNFYDTRFLCDYYHINNNIKGRCSIYYLLLEHKIINEKKFNELEKIEDITGPIYLIHIDIHKLDYNVFRYSLYDVLYLPELIKKFINMGSPYSDIIPEITSFINKYKRNPKNNFNEIEQTINSMNINFIYEKDNMILLNDIFEIFNVTVIDGYIAKIQKIDYFRKIIDIFIKLIIYYNISIHFDIYKNKNNKENINLIKYIKYIENYPHIKTFLQTISTSINNDLNYRIKK